MLRTSTLKLAWAFCFAAQSNRSTPCSPTVVSVISRLCCHPSTPRGEWRSLFPELERLHRPQPPDLPGHPLERPTVLVALRKHRQTRETHPLLRRRKLEKLRAQTVEIASPLVHRQRLATEP